MRECVYIYERVRKDKGVSASVCASIGVLFIDRNTGTATVCCEF